MSILFVADVHLCIKEPKTTFEFLNFLHHKAKQADALYILGDLFDTWIGDDDPNPLYNIISEALKELKKYHVPCYLLHGNHDFLIGKKYSKDSNIILLPKKYVLNLPNNRIVLLHGDILCTNDLNYQKFRKKIHNLWLQRLFLFLPISLRLYIIKKIKEKVLIKNIDKITNEININNNEVIKILLQTNTITMIHGHTHNAGIYKIAYQNNTYYRAVLGSWRNQGSFLEINKKEIMLTEFSFNNFTE